jgi:hypothetical protein
MTYGEVARVSGVVEAQDRLIANGCDPTTTVFIGLQPQILTGQKPKAEAPSPVQ